MEIIKRIKESEKQAQEIVAQAKAQVILKAETDKKTRQGIIDVAANQRRQAIADAEEAASQQGVGETEQLKTQAKEARQQLRSSTEGKISSAADKVVSSLKG